MGIINNKYNNLWKNSGRKYNPGKLHRRYGGVH